MKAETKAYCDPFDVAINNATYIFLVIALATCLGTALVFGTTLLPGEDLIDAIFWPMAGAISFAVGLLLFVATEPIEFRISIGIPELDTDPDPYGKRAGVEPTTPWNSGEEN